MTSLRSMSDSDSDSDSEWFKQNVAKKSTWNINALTKAESVRLYDALAQSSTREEREAVLRRMIHFPYSMFSNLIKSVNDVFEKPRSCPPADYKHTCYKELKHVLNEFQQFLNDERIISDSGEPVRFTMKRTPKPTPKPLPPPFLYANPNPNPLPIGPNTYMLNITDFKLTMFATMILDHATEEEKRRFMQTYMVIVYNNDDSDMPMPPDVETLDNVISTILGKLRGNASMQIKMQRLLDYLRRLKSYTKDPAEIYVLYPFPAVHPDNPDIFRMRRIPTVRKLGGGGKRGGMRRRNQRTKKARKLR